MSQGKWQEMIGAAAFVVFCFMLNGCQENQRVAPQPKSASISIQSEKVKQEESQEFKRYRKAAEQGEAEAQYNLGVMYANPDRRAAEWVLSIGGQVAVFANDKKVAAKRLENLPTEPFFVYTISLYEKEKVTDDGLRLLKDLKQLSELHLRSTPVTNAGMQHLAKLTNLTTLNISQTSVGDDGLKHLTNLRNLTYLSLHSTKSGDKGLEHIKNLIKINTLKGGRLTTDDGLKHLGQMKQLSSLSLLDSHVTGSGLIHLPDSEKLVSLYLPGSLVTDSSLQNVGKFKNLKILDLHGTKITDVGLKHLESFKRLELLDLKETKVTITGINALTKKLPQCKITYGPEEEKPIVIEPTLR